MKFKNITSQKIWSFMSLFVVFLVIMIPVNSAQALAGSISITQNSGQNGIDGYLDATGDVWNVVAQVNGVQTLEAANVLLSVSGTEVPFTSCSGSSCEYQSVLDSGIPEGVYPFQVILIEDGSLSASDSDIIRADGSSPLIQFNVLTQEHGQVLLDFSVNDQPNDCIGLDNVELVDADSGVVLQSFSGINGCTFEYATDGGSSGVLPVALTGDGRRTFKVRATDLFGHVGTSSGKSFASDFIAPAVVPGSLEFTHFGEYVGPSLASSSVTVKVVECQDLETVTATSAEIEFFSQNAVCQEIDDDECIHLCTWSDLPVQSNGGTLTAQLIMVDEAENIAVSTVTKSLVSDVTSPDVELFQTPYVFEDRSYLPAGKSSKLTAVILEAGSGINENLIAANLLPIGGSEYDNPESCTRREGDLSRYECVWNLPSVSGSITSTKDINIRFLQDVVGNEGQLFSKEIVVDAVPPTIEDIEVFGISAVGQKDYFQSHDDLVVEFLIREQSGVVIYVNGHDIVMDSETIYAHPENANTSDAFGSSSSSSYTSDGWARFTHDSCNRLEEGLWECSVRVESLKSGYDSAADLDIVVTDTAGNRAENWPEQNRDVQNGEGQEGVYTIEIFALDEETEPDFWEQRDAGDPAFVNLDISELTPPRISHSVGLRSSNGALATLIEIGDCIPQAEENASVNAPAVRRTVLYGGVQTTSTPTVTVVMEFDPFSGDSILAEGEITKVVDYVCSSRIFTLVDNSVLSHPESQDLYLPVEFGHSAIGTLDENIDELIQQEVEDPGFQILDKLSFVTKILRYGDLALTFLQAGNFIFQTIDAINSAMDTTREGVQGAAGGKAAATATCYGTNTAKEGLGKLIEGLTQVLQVFYCKGAQDNFQGEIGKAFNFAARWQANVLQVWKFLKGDYASGITFKNPETGAQEVAIPNAIHSGSELENQGGKYTYDQLVSRGTAASLYDNIWIGAVGLCVPSVFYNLEKMRQAHCAKLSCLKNDVPAGLATVDGCFQIQEYLICKYVLGEVLAAMNPMTMVGRLLDSLKTIIFDPVGTAMGIISAVCTQICNGSGAGVQVCSVINWLMDALAVVNNVIQAVQGIPHINYDLCEEAGINTDPDSSEAEESDGSASVTSDQASGGAS